MGKIPSTITGVAPWAFGNAGRPSGMGIGEGNPPVTITGVAPWANSSNQPPKMKKPKTNLSSMKIDESKTDSKDKLGRRKFNQYMDIIRPPAAIESTWAIEQLHTTPTLLPDLKFHSLVFGQTLGSGTFSTVKYARKIGSGSRSNWGEYAVKVLSLKTLKEHKYSKNVEREIAVLKCLEAR